MKDRQAVFLLPKNLFACSRLLALLLIASGCSKFCKCDPDPGLRMAVRFVNGQGRNLLFGSQRLFNADSLQLFQQLSTSSTKSATIRKGSDSATISLSFSEPQSKSYLYYNRQTPLDSLEVDWVKKEGKCCGERHTHYDPGAVRFNGTAAQAQNGVYTFVK